MAPRHGAPRRLGERPIGRRAVLAGVERGGAESRRGEGTGARAAGPKRLRDPRLRDRRGTCRGNPETTPFKVRLCNERFWTLRLVCFQECGWGSEPRELRFLRLWAGGRALPINSTVLAEGLEEGCLVTAVVQAPHIVAGRCPVV